MPSSFSFSAAICACWSTQNETEVRLFGFWYVRVLKHWKWNTSLTGFRCVCTVALKMKHKLDWFLVCVCTVACCAWFQVCVLCILQHWDRSLFGFRYVCVVYTALVRQKSDCLVSGMCVVCTAALKQKSDCLVSVVCVYCSIETEVQLLSFRYVCCVYCSTEMEVRLYGFRSGRRWEFSMCVIYTAALRRKCNCLVSGVEGDGSSAVEGVDGGLHWDAIAGTHSRCCRFHHATPGAEQLCLRALQGWANSQRHCGGMLLDRGEW